MMVVEEYTGLLIGGPDDGKLVTASVVEIPITSTVELWLDGEGYGKVKSTVVTHGKYIWKGSYFLWTLDRNKST